MNTCFVKSKVRHLVGFFSTRCRTSDKNKIDQVLDLAVFSTSSRIRRVVMFDERVFDEKSCIGVKQRMSLPNTLLYLSIKQILTIYTIMTIKNGVIDYK